MNDDVRIAADQAVQALGDLLSDALDYLETYLLPLADGVRGRKIANQFNNQVIVNGIDEVGSQLYKLAAFGDKEVADERN